MRERCKNSEEVCQDWPKKGNLKKNMDKRLNTLKGVLKNEDGMVYAYVLTTVGKDGNRFVQKGSAPNFQGGLITFCTCKHYMRTWRSPNDWKGVWIAGFTGVNIMGNKRNYLFYLMRVRETFPSQKAIWGALLDDVKSVKNSGSDRCGDIYEHKSNISGEYDISSYYEPLVGHVHRETEQSDDWHSDINYKSRITGRRPVLLVGDPCYSFLWSSPIAYSSSKLPRTKKWDNIQHFIHSLASK